MILADDDAFVRRSVRDALHESGVTVIAESPDGREAVELVVHYRPEVAVLDVVMPRLDGIAATALLRERAPETRVLLVTHSGDDDLAIAGLRAGAAGFLRKDAGIAELVRGVHRLAGGATVVDPAVLGALLERLREAPQPGVGLRPVSSVLTDREWEVLDALCVGHSIEDIADAYVLSLETVRSHAKAIRRKLGVHTQADAIAAAGDLRRPSIPAIPHRNG